VAELLDLVWAFARSAGLETGRNVMVSREEETEVYWLLHEPGVHGAGVKTPSFRPMTSYCLCTIWLSSVTVGRRPSLRLAFRVTYLICIASCHVAAWLAADYRALARASGRWGPLVVPLQLPVLLAWWPARALSLSTFAICQTLAARLTPSPA
jgi:hypothetical protein